MLTPVTVRTLAADPPASLDEAVAVLRAGGLVAIPTETVYGLAALAEDDDAVAKVFVAKGRPRTHPLIVHVRGVDDVARWAKVWSPAADRLARAFWPGPLTLVVPKRDDVSDAITGGADSVALRAPNHPIARALLAKLGRAVVAPSANRYQSISPTRAEHVAASLADAPVDVLVLDGGASACGLESTVVDVRSEPCRVLRPGTIGREALEHALGAPVTAFEGAIAEGTRPSPGMDARHYAPQTTLELAAGRAQAAQRESTLRAAGRRVVRVSFGPDGDAVALPPAPDAAARELYALLHRLDGERWDVIVVEHPPAGAGWDAVVDRLTRASR